MAVLPTRRRLAAVLTVVLLAGSGSACSSSGGGSGSSGSSSPSRSSSSSSTSSSGSSTSSAGADCPTLGQPKVASPDTMIACTSVTIVRTAAVRLGLKADVARKTVNPGIDSTVVQLNKLVTWRLVGIYHEDNGAVAQVNCDGVIGTALDATLRICTDVGAGARSDVAAARAWALQASRTILAKPATVLRQTFGDLSFLACRSDTLGPPQPAGISSQMQLYVQAAKNGFHTTTDCTGG